MMDSLAGELGDLLLAILLACETNGERELATRKLGQFMTARYGSVGESKNKLGELATARDAFGTTQVALQAD